MTQTCFVVKPLALYCLARAGRFIDGQDRGGVREWTHFHFKMAIRFGHLKFAGDLAELLGLPGVARIALGRSGWSTASQTYPAELLGVWNSPPAGRGDIEPYAEKFGAGLLTRPRARPAVSHKGTPPSSIAAQRWNLSDLPGRP